MEKVTDTGINLDKVREGVSEYINNKGYLKERTFGPERLGLDGFPLNRRAEMIGLKAYSFWDGMSVLADLRQLFKPAERIYKEGKSLYAKASVLTQRYKEISEANDLYRRDMAEDYETNPGFLGFNRLMHLFHRFFFGDYIAIAPLPKMVSEQEGENALSELLSWLQENHKIKNHTSIVCLDQLQNDGLKLDERVSKELERIPDGYLEDPFVWNEAVSYPFRLRKSDYHHFGGGLYDPRADPSQ